MLLSIALTACGGGGSHDDPARVARIELAPGGELLAVGDHRALAAHAFDSDGAELDVAIALQVDGSGVSANGLEVHGDAVGAALVTATAGDATSAPVEIVVAGFADGVVLVDDASIVSPTTAIDADLGTFSVELAPGVDPPVGAIVVASEGTPLAGRVISSSGRVFTMEEVTLDDVFTQMDVDLTVPLAMDAAAIAAPLAGVQIGPFSCDLSIDPSIVSGDITITATPSVSAHWQLHKSGLIHYDEIGLTLVRTLGVDLAGSVEVNASITGTLDCKLDGPVLDIPATGALDFLIGARFQPQLGASLDVTLGLSGLDFGFDGSLTDEEVQGFDWTSAAGFAFINEHHWTPEVSASASASDGPGDWFFESDLFAYAGGELFAAIGGGLHRFDLARVRIGPVLSLSTEPEASQVADPVGASGYDLKLEAKIEAGASIDKFLKKLTGGAISPPSVTLAVPLDSSPEGTLTPSQTDIDYTSGGTIALTVDFTPDALDFLGLPDVDHVEVDRVLDDGSLMLVGIADATSTDQTSFAVPWTPGAGDVGDQTFVAFVVPTLLYTVPLEIAADSRVVVHVTGPVCGDNACDPPEDAASCPADCPDVCPDGACTGAETAASCPADCPDSCGDGLCTGGESNATCPGDCLPPELCNHLDDDGDGDIDDGFVYTETASSRHSVVETDSAAIMWAGSNGSQAVVSWDVGPGTVADQVRVQVTGLDGAPIGSPTTIATYQPSNWEALAWMTDRFVVVGTQRSYACATCNTYLASVDASGNQVASASAVYLGDPWTGGLFATGGQFYLTSQTASDTAGAIRVQTFDRTGQGGTVDRTLLTPTTGTIDYIIRAAASSTEIYWIYMSSTAGLELLVTDLAAVPIRGPFVLDATGSIDDRHPSPIALVGSELVIVLNDGGTTYLGRWDTNGALLGPMTAIGAQVSRATLSVSGNEIYVLYDGPTPSLARLSTNGDLVQPLTPLPFTGTYCGLVAVPDGALAYCGSNSGTVTWTHLGC